MNIKRNNQIATTQHHYDNKNFILIAHCGSGQKVKKYEVPTANKTNKLKEAWGVQ
jgi:hypothetical protein